MSAADDDNTYAIGNLMVHINEQENASDGEDLPSIPSTQLNTNIDSIEPSLFMPSQMDQRGVEHEEQEISSTIQSIGEMNDVSRYMQPPREEPLGAPSYMGFVPYSSVYQGPPAMQYPYSSTPFHNVVPYMYHQSLDIASSHMQQMYIKRIFHSEVTGTHSNPIGVSPDLSNYDMKPSNSLSMNENLSLLPHRRSPRSMNDNLGEDILREDSGFEESLTRTTRNDIEALPPSNQMMEAESSESQTRFLSKNQITNSFYFDNRDKDGTDYANPYSSGKLEDRWYASQDFGSSLNEEASLEEGNPCTSDECSIGEAPNNTSFKSSPIEEEVENYGEDVEHLDEIEKERIRPERYRKCKSLFQKTSSGDKARTQLVKGFVKPRPKATSHAELMNCSECDYSSYNKSNFKNHLFIHSEARLFACPYCTYRGKQSAGLRAHLKVHSVEKPFKCSICNYKCKRKQNLIQHFRIHSKFRPFQCTYCEYRSTTKQSLQKHMVKHFGENAYQSRGENSHFKLAITGNTLESEYSDVFATQSCPKPISEEEKMVTSSQDNIPDENCPASDCSQSTFSSVEEFSLNNHTKSLITDLYECSFCNYKSKLIQSLRLHMASHKKSNSLKCNSCEFESQSASQFINHLQFHKNEEKYNSESSNDVNIKCEENPFRESSTAIEEKYVFQCPYCYFDYEAVEDLKLHISNHSPDDFISYKRPNSQLVKDATEQLCGTSDSLSDLTQYSLITNEENAEKDSTHDDRIRGVASQGMQKDVVSDSFQVVNNHVEKKSESPKENFTTPKIKAKVKGKNVDQLTVKKKVKKTFKYLKWNFSAKKKVKSPCASNQAKRNFLSSKNFLKAKLKNKLKREGRFLKNSPIASTNFSSGSKYIKKPLTSANIKNEPKEILAEINFANMNVNNKSTETVNINTDNLPIGSNNSCSVITKSEYILASDSNNEAYDSFDPNFKTAIERVPDSHMEFTRDVKNTSFKSATDINKFKDVVNKSFKNSSPNDYENTFERDKNIFEDPDQERNIGDCDQPLNESNISSPDNFLKFNAERENAQLTRNPAIDCSLGFANGLNASQTSISPSHYEQLHRDTLHSQFLIENNSLHFNSKDTSQNSNLAPECRGEGAVLNEDFSKKELKSNEGKAQSIATVSHQIPYLNFKYEKTETNERQTNLKMKILNDTYDRLKSKGECKLLEYKDKLSSLENAEEYETQQAFDKEIKTELLVNEGYLGNKDPLQIDAQGSIEDQSIYFPESSVQNSEFQRKLETSDINFSDSSLGLIEDLKLGAAGIEKSKKTEMFKCNTCDSKFRRKSSLVNHKRSHVKDEFKCSKCPFTFRYKKAMEDHEKIHPKDKLFKCTDCDFSSLRKCSLMSHYRIHRRKFKCTHCNFKCSLIKRMERHYYLKHNQERRLKCSECEFTAENSSQLKQHHSSQHAQTSDQTDSQTVESDGGEGKVAAGEIQVSFQCTICGLPFFKASDLENHQIQIHTVPQK